MTSGTMRPSRGRSYAEGRGYGLVLFAGVLLLVSGFWNLIYGIAAIAQSHVFVANAHYVFGNLRAWGWVTLIFAILLLMGLMGKIGSHSSATLEYTGLYWHFVDLVWMFVVPMVYLMNVAR